MQTITYLLSIPAVKAAGEETLNKRGFTAFDMADHFPRDFVSLKIRHIFMDFDVGTQRNQYSNLPPASSSQPTREVHKEPKSSPLAKPRWWSKWIGYFHHKDDWLDESRGSMMVVATVISTMTFQSAITPPGGVWQNNVNSKTENFDCGPENICEAGTAVLARSAYSDFYLAFEVANALSFLASLSVILLLISGLPLKNKVCTWVLTITMCVTLTSLFFTFFQARVLVNPDNYIPSVPFIALITWICMLSIIMLLHGIRFLSWVVTKLRNKYQFTRYDPQRMVAAP